jgi:hypothetical protein
MAKETHEVIWKTHTITEFLDALSASLDSSRRAHHV